LTEPLRRIFQGLPGRVIDPPEGVNFDPFTVNVSPRPVHQATAEREHELAPEPSHQGEHELAPEPSHQGTGSAPTGQLSTPWLQVQQQTSSQPPVKENSGTLETGGSVEARDTYWLLPAIAIGIALIIVLLAVILTIVIMRPG